MRVAFGNDHAGLSIKAAILDELAKLGHEVTDLGVNERQSVDFPDYAARVGHALQNGEADRGILVCGSGVGMVIAANKMRGIRAGLVHDTYSAHQGVEHDDMNVLCLGGQIIGEMTARELVRTFMGASFEGHARFQRRVDKITSLENQG